MRACDVTHMLRNSCEDPCFFVNYEKVGRGIVGDINGNNSYIKATKFLNCWRILGDQLQKVEDNTGILFDNETYLIQWIFEFVSENITQQDTLYYYWKGNNATKGYSPLPVEIQEENPAVERICQWSEPALFFHMFSTPLIVFSGSSEEFDPNKKRLFMIRGELPSEIHLYEVPCSKDNLRSRGAFILLLPDDHTMYYLYGSGVSNEYQHLITELMKPDKLNKQWRNFNAIEIKDDIENDSFFKLLESQTGNYIRLSNFSDCSPRLFYFNSITGDFLATEVEYPLRTKNRNAAFPFLQSHLYTADQPALFLLDNDKEIWLWEGWKTPESNLELFEKELELAKETANNYAKEKNQNMPILVKHVLAGLEPLDFINIFPYWSKRNDIAEMQLK